jgi:uncharacterized membrane protein YqjE
MGARLPASPAAGGLFDALRAIGATLADMACLRGALASVELREEIERRKQLLALAIGGALFLHTAFLLLTVAVASLFWDTHRMAALGTMIALYLAIGAGLFLRMRLDAAAAPQPFAATLHELGEDIRALHESR